MLVIYGLLLKARIYFVSLGASHAEFAALFRAERIHFFVNETDHITKAASSLRLVVLAEIVIALIGAIVMNRRAGPSVRYDPGSRSREYDYRSPASFL
jgi:hypothetical protein